MSINWLDAGELDVTSKGKLPLFNLPKAAGLYRLVSAQTYCYVGQAQNIRNRVYEYCRPTQHNEHEHRIHLLLRNKICRVQVFVEPSLEALATRRSLERAAMLQAKQEGLILMNLSAYSKAKQYKLLIQYHHEMILKYEALRRELKGETHEV